MDELFLQWSCTKSKFRQIMISLATYGSYSEVLGNMSMDTWILVIDKPKHSSFFAATRARPFSKSVSSEIKTDGSQWSLSLRREKSVSHVYVNVQIISYNKIVSTSVDFNKNENSKSITKYDTTNLRDYCLDLVFMFEKNGTPKHETFEEKVLIKKWENLSQNILSMLENEHMTDITLQCDTIVLKAHKSILSIQSPVFEAMFTDPMFERKSNTVTVKGVDPSVFESMIQFLYSGQLELKSEAMVYDLLYAADKFQIKALKEGCVDHLKSILSKENAVRILEISDLFDGQLKLHSLTYIKNNLTYFKDLKEWTDLKLKNPVLALEIYSCDEDD